MKNFLLFFSFMFLTFSSFGQIVNPNNQSLKEKDRRIYKEQQITNFNSPDNSQVIIFQEDFNGSAGAFTINTVTGPAPWQWTNSGMTGDYPTSDLASTTSSNGFAGVYFTMILEPYGCISNSKLDNVKSCSDATNEPGSTLNSSHSKSPVNGASGVADTVSDLSDA